MQKGHLEGKVLLDSLPKENLYGIGPVAFLAGEIMIMDGKCYVAKVVDGKIEVAEDYVIEAPFFGFAQIPAWKPLENIVKIDNLLGLENFLNSAEISNNPYFFKVEAEVMDARIHVMELPLGESFSSPKEAHQKGKNYFELENKKVALLGFYSTQHHAVFTHHNTNIHVHLITDDKKMMGHLDVIHFKPESVKIFVPRKL